MRRIKYLFIFIYLLLIFISPVLANETSNTDTPDSSNGAGDTNSTDEKQDSIVFENQYAYIKTPSGNGVKVRPIAGTSQDAIGWLDERSQVKILEKVKTSDGTTTCASGYWYKLEFYELDLQTGYGCSNFIYLIEEQSEEKFEQSLEDFPFSYHEKLKELHKIYPNAVFQPVFATYSKSDALEYGKINMDFDKAVYYEYITNNKSLINDINNSRDGLKNLNTYDYITNTFKQYYEYWYSANEQTIAYYLDPRNFLNEKEVFMFESLGYNSTYHNTSGIESILEGSYMHDAYVDELIGQNVKKFSDTIFDAGVYSGVSPYFLASRILQEVGRTRSALVMGIYPNYPEYDGYYNYYNISAGGSELFVSGMNKALESGWNSEYNAIVLGSKWIGNNYISDGQDTQYFQKWDIQCGDNYSCFSHQYMQNIEAPKSEARKMYSAYNESLGEKMYSLPYLFLIPVYENMPDVTSLPSSKSPINYLSRLVVNGSSVANFNSLTLEYKINVTTNTTSINIEASSIDNRSTIKGIGDIEISKEQKEVLVTVIAENGAELVYKIGLNWTLGEELNLEDTIKKIKGMNISDGYITGVTNVDTIKEIVSKANNMAEVTVFDNNGKEVSSGSVGTDYTVKLSVLDKTNNYVVIIYGDTNGDTEITVLDLLRVQKQLLSSITLSKSQLKASDINKDGNVDVLDLLLIRKHLLGSTTIGQ